MRIQLIGKKFKESGNWIGCALGKDGCVYAMPLFATRILKINPANDSTTLIGPKPITTEWNGCIAYPDGHIYGIPWYSGNQGISKFNPDSEEVSVVRDKSPYAASCHASAAVAPNGIIYFIPGDGDKILRCDPISGSTSLIGDNLEVEFGWNGAVTASDGCIYIIPTNARQVLKIDPNDDSIIFIGDDFGADNFKWRGAVLGADGNIYGVPYDHNMILKIDVANQSTSLVGPDLGDASEEKYCGGVLGYDQCIYMLPYNAENVLRFNPITGATSTVGQSLGDEKAKYCGGVLAPNGYIYAPPSDAKQVLKIRSWSNWLYLKQRLLVENRRATRSIIQFDDDLNIVQHFIIHTNDDIFRTVLEML